MQWIKLDDNSITDDLFHQLVDLEINCGLEPFTSEMLWCCINEMDTFAWMDGNTIAGFITIQPYIGYLSGGIYIVNLNVGTAYRRQGLGSSLMLTSLAQYGYSHQGRTISLDVEKNNIAALNLYKKLGFHITDFPSDNGPNDYVMITQLDKLLGTCVTDRLTLRPIIPENAITLTRLLTDDSVKETYMVPDFDETTVSKLVNHIIRLSYNPKRYVRGIYQENNLIGLLNDVEIINNRIELGWLIAPTEHNKGYATEVLKAALDDLFSKGFRCVAAGAFAENKASVRVMEKAGMQLTQRRDEIEYRGKTHHCLYFERCQQ